MAGKSILAAFGQVVREARQANRLSQEQLALGAGLNRNYVMDIEAGRRKPSIITIFALARGLGVSPTQLIAHTERLTRQSGGR